MKTLTLTILSVCIAVAASSCCGISKCSDCPSEQKVYDTKGRLVKHSYNGNYDTYHYDGKYPDDCDNCDKTKIVKLKPKTKLKNPLKRFSKLENPFKGFKSEAQPATTGTTSGTGWFPRVP